MNYRWKQISRKHRVFLGVFPLLAAYFFVLWKNMLVFRSDGLYAGHPYVWADWSMHIGMITHFAYTPLSNWLTNHPFYSGVGLSYPFLTNVMSAVLLRMGWSYPAALLVPSFILSLLLIIALYGFFLRFLSRGTAVAAVILFLWSGGIGFLTETWLDPRVVLTQIPDAGIEFTNIFMGMLLPQRAFLLGLPIGLVILTVLTSFFFKNQKRRVLIAAGVMSGLLPIIHTHTFIVIVLMSGWMFLSSLRKIREWMWFGVPALLVSLLVYRLLLFNPVQLSFLSLQLGWMAPDGLINWIVFWMKNWGVFLLLAIFGTIMLFYKQRTVGVLILGWWMIFFLANTIQFQPQIWDNSKLLAWSYLGLCIPAASVIHMIFQKKRLRVVAIVLFLLASLSGAIDMVHLLDRESKTYRMLDQEQIEFSLWVRDHTPPTSIILTSEMVANPVVMFSGRSVLMGYSGWVFSYGFPYRERQEDIEAIYRNPRDSRQLLDRYHIHYIVVPAQGDLSEEEREIFRSSFVNVFENGYGTLYAVTPL